MGLNRIVMDGHLTRDPHHKELPSGQVVVEFGIANNQKFGDKEQTCFLEVKAWGKTGENVHKFFRKGLPITVEGTLRMDSWDDKTTGQKRTKHYLNLDRFHFPLGGGGKKSEPQQEADDTGQVHQLDDFRFDTEVPF